MYTKVLSFADAYRLLLPDSFPANTLKNFFDGLVEQQLPLAASPVRLALREALEVYRSPGGISGHTHTLKVLEALRELEEPGMYVRSTERQFEKAAASDLIYLQTRYTQLSQDRMYSALLWLGALLHDLGKAVTGMSEDHLETGYRYYMKTYRSSGILHKNLSAMGFTKSEIAPLINCIGLIIRYHSYIADAVVLGERNLLTFAHQLRDQLPSFISSEDFIDILLIINASDMAGLGFLEEWKLTRMREACAALREHQRSDQFTDDDHLWYGRERLRAWFGELVNLPEPCSDEFIIQLGRLEHVNLVCDVFKKLKPALRLRFIRWLVTEAKHHQVSGIGLSEEVRKNSDFIEQLDRIDPLSVEDFQRLFVVANVPVEPGQSGAVPVRILIRK